MVLEGHDYPFELTPEVVAKFNENTRRYMYSLAVQTGYTGTFEEHEKNSPWKTIEQESILPDELL